MKKIKENLLIVFSKLIYVIQFVLCLIEGILFLKLIIDKNNFGNWQIKYIIGIVIVGITIVIHMFFIIKKYNKSIEKMFLLFAIPIGILYMLFLIPTYAPDENYHAYRAYQVSEGEYIVKINEDGQTDTLIPQDLIDSGIDRRNE